MFSKVLYVAVAASFASMASAQSTLTLDEALKLAEERNGTIIAARFDVEAARQRVNQARSAFLPTITPQYTYNSNRTEIDVVSGSRFAQQEGGNSLVRSSWRLLDGGERMYSLRSSKSSLSAQQFSAEQTLRSTLFTVTQQYFEALRSQELQKVANAQVERSNEILKSVLARIEAKDAAEIERYQAEADLANAKVQSLVARNRVSSTSADLKGTIGLEAEKPLPVLVADTNVASVTGPVELSTLEKEGLANRADLQARRLALESLGFSRSRARREAGLSFGVDASFDQHLTPKSLEDRAISLNLTYPLFDGGNRRAIVRELDQNIQADRAALQQAERTVRAEIEATHSEFRQNFDRLEAAQVALNAAKINYQAALDSRKAGAYDLLQVIAAQLSLVTAESNHIEAVYDYKISEARLNLVTGRPIRGS